jgi:hypothetical protein
MRLRTLLASLGFMIVSHVAHASGVVLRSDTFLKVCKIEVAKGARADGAGNGIVFSGAVEKGWSYQTHDRDFLCYRRSSDPADCWSPLTSYRCMTWTADGQISMPVQ